MLKHSAYGLPVFLSVILLSVITISCDDDEPSDVQKPTVGVEIFQNGVAVDVVNPVRGIVTLKATAEDNQKVKSIRLFVDDQLVGEAEDLTVMESSFDTRTVEDKAHAVKAIVEDNAGNVSEMISDVTTKNVLFRYSFPSGFHFYPNEWIVLSDKDGKVIGYEKITSKTQYTFLYPLDFTQNDFDYTLIQKETPYANRTVFHAKTIKNMLPGEYMIPPSPTGALVKGWYSIFFNEPYPFTTYFNVIASDPSFTQWTQNNQLDIALVESVSLFICFDNSKYIYKPSIAGGQSLTINQNFVDTQMIPLSSVVIPNTGEGSVEISGIRADGSPMQFMIPYSSPDEIDIKYPKELKGNGFVDFLTTIDFERTENTREVHHKYVTRGIPSSLSELQSMMSTVTSLSIDNIKLSFTGSADRIGLNYDYRDYDPATNLILLFDWNIHLPFSSSVDTQFPELPSTLKSAMGLNEIPDLMAKTLTLTSTVPAFTYDQYSGMLLKGYSAEYNASEKQSKEYFFNPNETGGRMRK